MAPASRRSRRVYRRTFKRDAGNRIVKQGHFVCTWAEAIGD